MRVWVTVLLSLTALAGCAEDAAEPEATDDGFVYEEELQATADTGIIRGVVVDSSITPIAGVTVTIISSEAQAFSNENGAFGFDDLDPGTYFLTAEKAGFDPVQMAAEVVAGVDDPPVLKILLERDLDYNPFASTQLYAGFYQCGTSIVVVCAAPGILLGFFGVDDPIGIDTSTPTIPVGLDPTYVQAEMVWETTQTLSPELAFQMEALDLECPESADITLLNETTGPSPTKAGVNQDRLERGAIGGPDCGIYYSVFSGDALGGAAIIPVGFSIEQPFEWYITEFHGFGPDADWWYIFDGAAVASA